MSYHPVKTWRPMHYFRDPNYAVRVSNTRDRGTTLGLSGGMPMEFRQWGGSNYYDFPITYGEHLDYVTTPLSGDSGDGLGSVLAVL